MPRTLIYASHCAVHADGKPDPFMMQEIPWLTAHFDKALMVSDYGTAVLQRGKESVSPPVRVGFTALRACLRTPFSRELWSESRRMVRERKWSMPSFLRLLRFTKRGLQMHIRIEQLLRGCVDSQTTLYSFWMSFDGYAAALSKRLHPKLRFVVRGHAFDIDEERNAANPYLMKRLIAAQADGVYLISEVAREQYMSYMRGNVDEKKVHVLAMGSGGEPVEKCKRAPRYAQEILRVVSCAKLISIKQVPVLVEAFAKWQGGPLHWTHIGGGEGMEALHRLAQEKLDPKENIIYELLGDLNTDEVNRVYEKRAFDVFINTSRKEGVPVAIMEAMRYGIPAIAPRVGGIPELVTEDVGFLYEPEDGADGVLAALNRLCAQQEAQANAMRDAAQKRWNKGYCSAALLPALFGTAKKKGA